MARLNSRRQSRPSSVTATIVYARPARTGPIINGSSTSHEPNRSHNSRRNPGPPRPVRLTSEIAARPASKAAQTAVTSQIVTGPANASDQGATWNINAPAARAPAEAGGGRR